MDRNLETMRLSVVVRAINSGTEPEEERLRVAVARFLVASGDDEVVAAYDAMLVACTPATAHADELLAALAAEVVAATVETVCETWVDVLDMGVRTTDADSVVGIHCIQLLLRAQLLLEDMADVTGGAKDLVRESVASQCRVFLYG